MSKMLVIHLTFTHIFVTRASDFVNIFKKKILFSSSCILKDCLCEMEFSIDMSEIQSLLLSSAELLEPLCGSMSLHIHISCCSRVKIPFFQKIILILPILPQVEISKNHSFATILSAFHILAWYFFFTSKNYGSFTEEQNGSGVQLFFSL